MVGHRERDRGDRHLEGDPVGLDPAQHLVEVEAAVQAHGGAGLGRGEQVEQAEDVRRRAWPPGSGRRRPRPRASHPVARCRAPIDAWVWRTAFGSPVVPELNTRIASSSGADVGDRERRRRSSGGATVAAVVEVGDGVRRRAARRAASTPAPSATAWTGPVRARAWSTSAAFHAGLSSTAAAPSLLMALTAIDELDAVGHHHRHPVAAADARGRRGGGRRRCSPVEVGEGPRVVADEDRGPVAVAAAARARASWSSPLTRRPRRRPPRARSSSFTTLPVAFTRQLVDELDARGAPCSWPSGRGTTR